MKTLRLGVTFIFLLCLLNADAQKKNPKPKKTPTTQKAPKNSAKSEQVDKEDIPPEVELLEETRIYAEPQEATIDFDTSASVNDALTREINELLVVTGALEADVKAAEASLQQSLGENRTEEMEVFYKRLIKELREGRARTWLTNLYIRTYRAHFTLDEISELIALYKTPIGKKLVQKQALIVQSVMGESRKIGVYLGQTLMAEIMQEKK